MNAQTKSLGILDEATYMKERVDDQLTFYERSASKAKRRYYWMTTATLIIGVLVPVTVNIPSEQPTIGNIAPHIKIIVTIMSVSLAILNGVLTFGRYQDLWLSYRMTEEILKHEKFLYQTRSGKYSKEDSPFSEFVQSIEGILSAEHNKFRSLIEDSKRPIGEKQ